eukprot:1376787-Amphidinium_carterae.1
MAFRGIVISALGRSMVAAAILQALGHLEISFAHVAVKGAQGLQLTMSQMTALMKKWYGECAIGEVDIQAAFDGFKWQHLLHTLLKRGVPEGLAYMTIHSQMSGYMQLRLTWL